MQGKIRSNIFQTFFALISVGVIITCLWIMSLATPGWPVSRYTSVITHDSSYAIQGARSKRGWVDSTLTADSLRAITSFSDTAYTRLLSVNPSGGTCVQTRLDSNGIKSNLYWGDFSVFSAGGNTTTILNGQAGSSIKNYCLPDRNAVEYDGSYTEFWIQNTPWGTYFKNDVHTDSSGLVIGQSRDGFTPYAKLTFHRRSSGIETPWIPIAFDQDNGAGLVAVKKHGGFEFGNNVLTGTGGTDHLYFTGTTDTGLARRAIAQQGDTANFSIINVDSPVAGFSLGKIVISPSNGSNGTFPIIMRPGTLITTSAINGAIEHDARHFYGSAQSDTASIARRAFIQQGDTAFLRYATIDSITKTNILNVHSVFALYSNAFLATNGGRVWTDTLKARNIILTDSMYSGTYGYNLHPSYSEFWVDTVSVAKTLTTLNVFYGVNVGHAGTTSASITQVTSDTSKLKMIISGAGIGRYKVSYNVSYKTSSTDTMHFAIFKNSTGQNNISSETFASTASTVMSQSASGILTLAANDTISLRVSCTSSGHVITINHFNFNINRIGAIGD